MSDNHTLKQALNKITFSMVLTLGLDEKIELNSRFILYCCDEDEATKRPYKKWKTIINTLEDEHIYEVYAAGAKLVFNFLLCPNDKNYNLYKNSLPTGAKLEEELIKDAVEAADKAKEEMEKLKEYLLNNKTIIELNVFEERRADFQLMDDNGNIFSPNDKGLKVLEDVDYSTYDEDWDKNATTYYGRIQRDDTFEFNQDEFLCWLDEFIEEGIESGEYDGSLEELVKWTQDRSRSSYENGFDLEESAGGGSCETFTAYGNSKGYLVQNQYLHEQNVYDLEIVIKSI